MTYLAYDGDSDDDDDDDGDDDDGVSGKETQEPNT